MKNKSFIIIIVFAAILGGCQKNTGAQGGGDQDTISVKAEKMRNEWQAKLNAMSIGELSIQLQKESSEGLEPFNSMTLKAIVDREKNSFDELRSLTKEHTRSSLLSLIALREMDAEKFKGISDTLKADILIDALKNAKTFNTFGMPHVVWEEAAKTIIECASARPGLTELLTDKREAPVWGSEDYMEYMLYKYRVCDYAYALLNSKGEPVRLSENQEERDKMIQAFLDQTKNK